MPRIRSLATLAFFFLSATTGQAGLLGIDGIDTVIGTGEQTDNFRFGLRWDLRTLSLGKGKWALTASLSPNYSVFSGQAQDGNRVEVKDFGLTPVLTLIPRKDPRGPFDPFFEIGIGAHYLSEKQVGPKTFSTHFQFGDHIGLGLRFKGLLDYKLAYSFQHLSNGGIDSPNPGINFHLLRLGFRLP